MPVEHGGGGLNAFDLTLVEKHLGFASLALAEIAASTKYLNGL